jgi:hypothetical protein
LDTGVGFEERGFLVAELEGLEDTKVLEGMVMERG